MHCSDTTISADRAIDALPRADALNAMLASHIAAARAVAATADTIDIAAQAVATALNAGATLHYAAAGSSGLMALADACEIPGTFGVPQQQIRIHMAGGVPADGHMPGDTEDSTDTAQKAAGDMQPQDVAIVVSASGTTPYALAFATQAQKQNARVIAIANVPGSALVEMADIAIALETAPEVIGGSTRLGAGTAQKIALNMISTLAGILLGHVHDGMMVNLNPENIKLRRRAADIVARISGVTAEQAEQALCDADYDTKRATLMAAGLESQAARTLLHTCNGHLRDCLRNIDDKIKSTTKL